MENGGVMKVGIRRQIVLGVVRHQMVSDNPSKFRAWNQANVNWVHSRAKEAMRLLRFASCVRPFVSCAQNKAAVMRAVSPRQ
jgi:hypothetical protein